MITVKEQEILFLDISRKLKKKIVCYAIGGTAMMFLNLKFNTKDIDLVFENEEDRKIFLKALEELEFKKLDSMILYGKKPNQPELLKRKEEEIIDLFATEVISFIFSKNSEKRAKKTHQFGENLIIKIADVHDIILMKHATDRAKDIKDIESIIKTENIDWNIILEEVKNQIQLGKKRSAMDLGIFLENLEVEGTIIPKNILDELFKIVENQAKEERKKIRKRKSKKFPEKSTTPF
ncbi:MAG: hypothetical protein Q8N99_04265 [Nanoarchaeota archaeon]|nr:hypothetical protein [Nanoarchaeota archaeon]